MRRMNGDSRKSVDLETSPPLPSSPSFNNSNFPSQQYSKHPVNDRVGSIEVAKAYVIEK